MAVAVCWSRCDVLYVFPPLSALGMVVLAAELSCMMSMRCAVCCAVVLSVCCSVVVTVLLWLTQGRVRYHRKQRKRRLGFARGCLAVKSAEMEDMEYWNFPLPPMSPLPTPSPTSPKSTSPKPTSPKSPKSPKIPKSPKTLQVQVKRQHGPYRSTAVFTSTPLSLVQYGST